MSCDAGTLTGLAILLLTTCSTGEPVDIDGSGTDNVGGEAAAQMLHVAIGGEPEPLHRPGRPPVRGYRLDRRDRAAFLMTAS